MALPLDRDSDISSIQPPDLATFEIYLAKFDSVTLEIYSPVMEFLETNKEKLPVELREAMERNEEWDLTPTQFLELLEQLGLPEDMLNGLVWLMELDERTKKWADDCEAFHKEVCRAIERARADGEEAAETSQATYADSDAAKEKSEESHACQRL